jgi:glycosyltransferase involved in cell wall biosynthesis
VALADAFVSLHRSEGLGLTMAEAMWVGTPVIATAYSGNLDFMPPGASLRVDPLGCVPVGPGLIYPAEGRWADPDLDQAAAHLARIRTDPALRAELARAGRLALDEFTPERVGRQVRARLEQIWADR